MDKDWVFYLIYNNNLTYAGVSPTPEKRLRQHNGEIKGGAKYTTGHGAGWKHLCIVRGFQNKIQAMQFEWAVKHEAPRNLGGIANRVKKMNNVLCKEKWTQNSPYSNTVPLTIENFEIDFELQSLPEYITYIKT